MFFMCIFIALLNHESLANTQSVQRGANIFINYCAGCHTLRYIPNYSTISLPKTDAIKWFGRMPPDLSLIIKVRGAPWVSAYLKGFYADNTRPFGVNNKIMPAVSMPNVLEPFERQVQQGTITAPELDNLVLDVVSFLNYVADPKIEFRYHLGLGISIFFLLMALIFYWVYWLI